MVDYLNILPPSTYISQSSTFHSLPFKIFTTILYHSIVAKIIYYEIILQDRSRHYLNIVNMYALTYIIVKVLKGWPRGSLGDLYLETGGVLITILQWLDVYLVGWMVIISEESQTRKFLNYSAKKFETPLKSGSSCTLWS